MKPTMDIKHRGDSEIRIRETKAKIKVNIKFNIQTKVKVKVGSGHSRQITTTKGPTSMDIGKDKEINNKTSIHNSGSNNNNLNNKEKEH